MKENKTIFLKALANSLLPEALDADTLDISSVSTETQTALTSFLDHHLGDADVGSRHNFKYEHINDFFGTKTIFEKGHKETPAKQIKTILGGFHAERTKTGYKITDTYDFFPRKGLTKSGEQSEENAGITDILASLVYGFTSGEGQYQTARMAGGYLIPENPDRSSKDPKQSSSLSIDWELPHGQEVARKQFASSVLTALGD
tara:strand:- start:131 stop:736 length:606 start_codon:yes stop_codon:yes gene_type:complete